MEKNLLQLHNLNKRVAEARKRVAYLKEKRTALCFRKRTVDVQTWMLNKLVDDACGDTIVFHSTNPLSNGGLLCT